MPEYAHYPALPTRDEITAARECGQVLSSILQDGGGMRQLEILSDKGAVERFDIPLSALKAFAEILRETGEGGAVKIVPMPADLSAIQASRMFGISLPVLIKALENSEIPSYVIGTRRRVLYTDLVEHKRRRKIEGAEVREKLLRQA